MELQKQTYLNTEHLQELYEKKERVSASAASNRAFGGVRFRLKRKSTVTLRVEFKSLSGVVSLYLDGAMLCKSKALWAEYDVRLERGEHIFDLYANVTHGGFLISAEGVGLEEARAYSDRVGGYSDATTNILWIRHGSRALEKIIVTSSSVTSSSQINKWQDSALLYDKSGGVYDSSLGKIYASSASSFSVDTGVTSTFAASGAEDLAICDGYTLPSGVDYLFAYVSNDRLYIGKATANASVASGDIATPIASIKRVVSAQRGSVLMAQNAEGVWKAFYFHPDGDKSLLCGSVTIPYFEVALTRNRRYAPTAHLDENTGHPVFYYRTEEGHLMKMPYGGSATVKGFAQAYHPGVTGGALQHDGDLQYAQL